MPAPLHAALLVSPGMGHLIPMLELAKCLVSHHDFRITLFMVSIKENSDASSKLHSQILQSHNSNDLLHIVSLESSKESSLIDLKAPLALRLVIKVRESLPLFKFEISNLKTRPDILIVDMFGTEAYNIADELGMLKLVFMTNNAWFLAFLLQGPTFDKGTIEDHVYLKKPLKLMPGCKPVRFEDTMEEIFQFGLDHPNYKGFLCFANQVKMADGILVNTWHDLESSSLKALKDNVDVPVYPVGPLTRSVRPVPVLLNNPVKNWLEMQPNGSVIYISFGSGGSLSTRQMTELAYGLESSRERFVWVVRPPSDDDACATYLTMDEGMQTLPGRFLPNRFLTRTRDRGMVVPMWAPQEEVLAHPSIGAFLTHCGWNSVLESILNAVPMIAWPLFAEQKMNAAVLVDELGVAIRPKTSLLGGIVGRREIKTTVSRIMTKEEGEPMRARIKELKNSALRASAVDGSSHDFLSQLAKISLNASKEATL